MKIFQVAKWEVTENFGKELYLAFFLTEKYSLLQVDFGYEYPGKWSDPPYLQISMGYGKLFSFLFCCGRISVAFDFVGRNWRDETFYE